MHYHFYLKHFSKIFTLRTQVKQKLSFKLKISMLGDFIENMILRKYESGALNGRIALEWVIRET